LIEKINSLEELYQVTGGTDLLTLYEQFAYIVLAHIALTCDGNTRELPGTVARLCDGYRLTRKAVSRGTDEIYRLYQERIRQIGRMMEGRIGDPDIQIANSDVFSLILDIVDTVLPPNSDAYPDDDLKFLLEYMLDDCLNKSRGGYFGTSSSLAAFILEAAGGTTPASVYDPSCGTGAFLAAASRRYAGLRSLVGNEQNPQLQRIAQINMLFFGFQADIQSRSDDEIANWGQEFDFVAANPPFNTLPMNDAHFYDLPVQTKHRYRAFIQILLQKIRRGGRGAIIVPNSFLLNSNRDAVSIRQWILENYIIEGIISLPANTFYPRANVNASVIIIAAGYEGEIDPNRMVAMLESPQTPRNRAAGAEDFDALLRLWHNKNAFLSEWAGQMHKGSAVNLRGIAAPTGWKHENIWFAGMEDIQRMDYCLLPKYYQPAGTFQMSLEEPWDIIREVVETERQVLAALETLEEELQRDA
jgi:type I restriction enzyme M protein